MEEGDSILFRMKLDRVGLYWSISREGVYAAIAGEEGMHPDASKVPQDAQLFRSAAVEGFFPKQFQMENLLFCLQNEMLSIDRSAGLIPRFMCGCSAYFKGVQFNIAHHIKESWVTREIKAIELLLKLKKAPPDKKQLTLHQGPEAKRR